jgi:O-glycosyl hydrolase
MTSLVYQIVGPTKYLLSGVTPGTANVTGVNTVKIDNPNNSNVDIFFNYGTSNTTTATIANATSTGSGICIQHGATEFVQLVPPQASAPITVYLAAASASNVSVYVTPVAVVS